MKMFYVFISSSSFLIASEHISNPLISISVIDEMIEDMIDTSHAMWCGITSTGLSDRRKT